MQITYASSNELAIESVVWLVGVSINMPATLLLIVTVVFDCKFDGFMIKMPCATE